MKKLFSLLAFLFIATGLFAQAPQELVSKCALEIGDNTTYLKDFVIRLPESKNGVDSPVYKANIYFMKNQTYRFTMCNSNNSDGELVMTLYDGKKIITTSFLEKSGTLYNSVDFQCNKTGLYQIWYSFRDGKKGYGAGIVSLVKR